ncbi:U-scoloptoxin(16)-Er8a-like [Schistocerca nitens]|uniref:U-scoloptoxin(16)-Er8a-like n=1 Tax=Schistocerca nitens TaxID=7011 RepID=UPI002117F617|nr:U-scoloptoxin(16)-Er8a-like [Schistocerca nitens]
MRASRVLVSALALLAAAIAVSEAAQSIKLLSPSADHPGKCYDPENQLVLAPGESAPAKEDCVRISCGTTDTGFQLLFSSCGSIGVPAGCVLDTPNPNLPYPRCCPELKC